MKFSMFVGAAALGAASFTSAAVADVSFYSIGSRLATRVFDDETGQILGYERVFTADMSLLAGTVFSDEPGYRNPTGIFSSSGTLKISIRKALRAWTGGGFAATTDRLNIQQFGGATSVYTPVTDPANPDTDPLTHFDWAVGSGELHQHADNYLVDSTLAGPGSPGIYLAEFHADVNVDGLTRSYPFWFLVNYGQSADDVTAAFDYTKEFIVPTPGVATALVLGGTLVSRRRRA